MEVVIFTACWVVEVSSMVWCQPRPTQLRAAGGLWGGSGYMLGNWVDVSLNIALSITAIVGQVLYLRNKRSQRHRSYAIARTPRYQCLSLRARVANRRADAPQRARGERLCVAHRATADRRHPRAGG